MSAIVATDRRDLERQVEALLGPCGSRRLARALIDRMRIEHDDRGHLRVELPNDAGWNSLLDTAA
jgi:hypothetical protein